MKNGFLASCLTGVFVLGVAGVPNATTLTWNLDLEFSGADTPVGTTPWLQVTISDDSALLLNQPVTLSADVHIALSAPGLSNAEFVGSWYFNLDPGLDASFIDTWYFPSEIGATDFSFTADTDNLKADGVGGNFDFLYDFNTGVFGSGETINFLLDYDGLNNPATILTANSFNFGSVAENGFSFLTAAHIQGIDPNADGSGWIAGGGEPVPEPATMLLFGIGLIGLVGLSRRKLLEK